MIYIRNAWYVCAWAHEIDLARPTGVRILNEPIVIWRTAAGHLTAFEDRCVHRFAPLSLGRCEGERLRCMYHGLLYDRGGKVVEIPGQDAIPAIARVRSYPVTEKGGWIWIWMGDAALADETLIPPVIGLDHPDFIMGYGQLDYAAEATLIIENLLDLSHVSFVHAESAPEGGQSWARQRPKRITQKRSLREERWFRGHEKRVGDRPDSELAGPRDRYFRSEFYVPGVLIAGSRDYPIGTADALNGQTPDLGHPQDNIANHAVTPITERSARYFYSAGTHRHFGYEAVRDALLVQAKVVFAEDQAMIEAQQKIIDATRDRDFMLTTADKGVALYNRIVKDLVRAERMPAISTERAGEDIARKEVDETRAERTE